VFSGGKRHEPFPGRRKDRIKAVRTVLQIVVLALIAYWIAESLFTINRYAEPDKSAWKSRDGFIAVSYFGVGRRGTNELIAKEKLKEQLDALQSRGYVTISRQDVLDYYLEGKPLPDKALFLAFEDGRNDSALFASPLLESHNYLATLMTYANKLGSREGKFLQPKEIRKLEKSGYWELGSNGYRLTYINIVDQDGEYLGIRDRNRFLDLWEAQYYTHYLMDFIRDENGIPLEDREEMEARIQRDYGLMEQAYKDELGELPGTYMIMHANTLYNGMHELVAGVNDREIRRLFQLHFNREGQAWNTADGDRYDLTRVQPAPYWRTNHLLMQIKHDTGGAMTFETGSHQGRKSWETLSGAAEHGEDGIALTSPPGAEGTMKLKGGALSDVGVSLRMTGHYSGNQSVYLRYANNGDAYIRLLLREGELVVEQKAPGQEAERLLAYPVDRDHADKELEAVVHGNKLNLEWDGKPLLEEQPIDDAIAAGEVMLSASADRKGVRWNEYDERDTIYDGVFERMTIRELREDGSAEATVYTNERKGLSKAAWTARKAFNAAVDWAIDTF
jgi:hypothetical protein